MVKFKIDNVKDFKNNALIGIMMLDTSFTRISGDIGNPNTYNFPVLYKVVKGALPERVAINTDIKLINPFIEAAKELEELGVKAITTSCGFLALFQKLLSFRQVQRDNIQIQALLMFPLQSQLPE